MIDLGFIEDVTVDYWYDVGCLLSRRTLERFSEPEWTQLAHAWPTQSEVWQERLAYIVGEGGTVREAELLLSMYYLANKNIALSAAESLRQMPFPMVRQAAIGVAAKSRFEASAACDCITTNQILDVFLELRSAQAR